MKSLIKGYFSLVLVLIVSLSALPLLTQNAKAEDAVTTEDEIKYVELYLDISPEDSSKDIRTKLQNAFFEARDYATPYLQYKVVLPENTALKISGNISIYSNTYFDLNGSTIVRDYSTSNVMFKFGRGESSSGYEGYGNITITNGTIDGWDNVQEPSTSSLMRLGHSQNILLENLTFVDNSNTHFVEIAACKDFTFKNCTFKDQHLVNGSNKTSEAIQIDALQDIGFPLYDYYDGTSCSNINVLDCTFENVTRGIGTHAVILGDNSYYKDITVSGCTFNNVSDYCIASLCWINVNIYNNTIKNSENGIIIRTMRSDYKHMFTGNFTKPISNYETTVENNTIDAKHNAVRLYGVNIPKAVEWSLDEGFKDTTPAGDYVLSNVKVKNNNITCQDTAVRLTHTKDSEISGNTVNVKNADSNKTGIYLTDNSYNNKISDNTVKNLVSSKIKSGILLSGSQKNNSITNNQISGKTDRGIFIYNGSNNTPITGNTVKNSLSAGIYCHSSKSLTVNSNTVSPDSGDGIYFAGGANSSSVKKNTVTLKTQNAGIGVNASTVKTASDNITRKGKYGMYLKNGTVTSLTKNTSENNSYGVYVNNSKSKIYSNYLNKNNSYGILTDASAKADIRTNSYTGNKQGNILLKGSKNIVTGNLALTANIKNKVTAYNKTTLSWTKAKSFVYHKIYKSTDKKTYKYIGYAKEGAYTYTDKNLVPNKPYYYQIVPAVRNGGSGVLGNTSDTKSAKTGVVNTSLQYVSLKKTGRVLIKWKNDFTPEKYQIYRKEKGQTKYKLIRTVDGTAGGCYDTTVLPGKQYYYKVRQICYDGNKKLMTGKISNKEKIKSQVVTGNILFLKRKNAKKVYVSVSNQLNNKGCYVYYSTRKNGTYNKIGSINLKKTYHKDLKLPKGKKYYIKVRAYTKIKGKTYYGSFSKIKKV